ncbi:MAG: osmoprotectant transport system permease protein [Baekduia sp.]|nr:osmoprotectant transport system permease protein [Baekduia sp.]
MHTFSDALTFIGDHPHLLWSKTLEHLWISAASIAVAMLLAIPLGVWLGHVHRGALVAINASNIGRALPSLAVISIGIGILGIGFANVLVAMVILAAPIMLTNAYVAVDQVDEDAVAAARAMGMRGHQILLRVELPLAWPLIFAGIRTASVYVVATATLAAIAGGGGLGDIIVNQASYGVAGVVAGALAVAVLAFLVEGAFALLQRALTPRGVKIQRSRRPHELLAEAS